MKDEYRVKLENEALKAKIRELEQQIAEMQADATQLRIVGIATTLPGAENVVMDSAHPLEMMQEISKAVTEREVEIAPYNLTTDAPTAPPFTMPAPRRGRKS